MPTRSLLRAVRALYRMTPAELRSALTRFASRSKWAQSMRASAVADGQDEGARLSSGDKEELSARREDFARRFEVASHSFARAPKGPATAPDESFRAAQLIAFYLPQFHRIPENDAWWGAGFTEWTNVARAIPQFVGHHQPRLPGELGFYDLTTPGVLAAQVALARAHGVSAFCFHYYWFAGRRLLERPLNAFIADRSLNMKFALCWANENWTRRWDGAEDEVLIAQRHSRDDHAAVFDDMARYLEDERALRVDGKPLIVLYRADIVPDAPAMLDIWRERAARRGWPGLYLAATEAFLYSEREARRAGFDGLVAYPPHGLSPPRIDKGLAWLNAAHRGAVYDYEELAEAAVRVLQARRAGAIDRFPGVMPGWDNEARRPGAANIFHNATPQAYGRWLAAACEAAERTLAPSRCFVFVNAWNEWAEGAYLEPDRRWGRAFLEETARVVRAPVVIVSRT